ncbi:MAG TPA: CCA tRNA nucleotidyltransferase [Euryarchaeota archaeon]|nr:CCA tRNA nucleotidyltransferase [Euryarchaeota archaeon]
MKLNDIILSQIIPSSDEQERIDAAVRELVAKTSEIGQKLGAPFEPQLVGSVAKGTHLTRPDIDLFLKFPVGFSKEEMGEIDKSIGRAILDDPEERYAEHPYISGVWRGFRTDLVPCYTVSSGRGKISAVDRTPFHTSYIQGHLSESQRDEVRLLKQFMKGIGCYGAEAKVQGFSGYLCELIVLRFRNFDGSVKAASAWKPPILLDLGNKTRKRFDDPLTFVDPVDPGRNVASPVSREVLELFTEACEAFLDEPSDRFFFPVERKPWNEKALAEALAGNPGTVLVELPALDVVDDVLWPQLRKTGKSIAESLEREGFRPDRLTLRSENERNVVVVSCKVPELGPSMTHFGPPEKSSHAEIFVQKWKGSGKKPPEVEGGRWKVELKRQIRTPKDLLVKKFRNVRLGKGFRDIESPKVLDAGELMKNNRDYRRVLTEHFDKRRPWQIP